jgi:hypothetical protein
MRYLGFLLSSVLVASFSLNPAAAQKNGVDESSPAEPPSPSVNSTQPLQRMGLQTFTGKITKHGNTYVLYDMNTNLTLNLDNQALAAKYISKDVSVVGQLLPPGSTIHVEKILRAK